MLIIMYLALLVGRDDVNCWRNITDQYGFCVYSAKS